MFVGELSEKTFDDVKAFLAQDLPEGVRLDYKAAFPSNLAKTMASMANTEGGLILVGVAEDPARPLHPIAEPVGVPVEQAEERVILTAYQAIREPLLPEVQPIPFDDDPSLCVVVIRVQPSPLAPHTIGDGSHVYRRVGSVSTTLELEERMQLQQIDWLLRRREQNADLLRLADERRRDLLRYSRSFSGDICRVDTVVSPVLARPEPLRLRELKAAAAQTASFGYSEYPMGPLRGVEGGLLDQEEPPESYLDLTGLSAHARTATTDQITKVQPKPERAITAFWLEESIAHIQWAGQAAVATGRGGELAVTIELRGIRDVALLLRSSSYTQEAVSHRALQDAATASTRVRADDAAGHPAKVAISLVQQIGQAFNWDQDDGWLRNALKIETP